METTGDPAFSMFNLSLKEDWVNNKKFCHRLSDDETIDEEGKQEAQDRLGNSVSDVYNKQFIRPSFRCFNKPS